MSEDNVWTSGAEEPDASSTAPTKLADFSYRGEEPTLNEVFNFVFKDISKNFMAYVWAGAPALLVLLGFFMFAIVVVFGAMFGAIGLGLDPEGPEFVFLIIGAELLLLMLVPLIYLAQIGVYRATWWHLTDTQEMSFGVAASAMWKRIGRGIGFMFVTGLFSFLGLLMCYLPIFFVILWMHLAMTIMIVDNIGPWAAYMKALRLFREHPKYHFKMVGVSTLMEMAIVQIPFVGWVVGYPMGGALHLVAYSASPDLDS